MITVPIDHNRHHFDYHDHHPFHHHRPNITIALWCYSFPFHSTPLPYYSSTTRFCSKYFYLFLPSAKWGISSNLTHLFDSKKKEQIKHWPWEGHLFGGTLLAIDRKQTLVWDEAEWYDHIGMFFADWLVRPHQHPRGGRRLPGRPDGFPKRQAFRVKINHALHTKVTIVITWISKPILLPPFLQ